MQPNMFRQDYGIIVALDFNNTDEAKLVIDTSQKIEGVMGHKIGFVLGMSKGLPKVGKELGKYTDLPLLHDHQKFVPWYNEEDFSLERLCKDAASWTGLLKKSGISGDIIYPILSYIDPTPQTIYTKAFFDKEVQPFILGRMTVEQCLKKEGGVIPDNTPELIYRRAAEEGVEYYIMPGNRPDDVKGFVDIVRSTMPEGRIPKICLPGHGSQKGNIKTAFKATSGLPSYGIIGPFDCINMTNRRTIRDSIKRYCDEALEASVLHL